MYYYGYFRNTDTTNDEKGQLYKVIIITDFKQKDLTIGGELNLSDSPFVVEFTGDDSNLQKPYKCSTATVGLLQNQINYNFFDTTGNNVLVQLLKWRNDNVGIEGQGWVGTKNKSVIIPNMDSPNADGYLYDVEWSGFVTPNAYSQNYETLYDEFELECQDAFSTLKYVNYSKLSDDGKYFVTLENILLHYALELEVYNNIYITDGVKVATENPTNILKSTVCDERNFFDEDGEPMKVMDVFDEIMKFYSLTIIPFKDNLYIINYDAIKNGHNSYYCINYPSIENYIKNKDITKFKTLNNKVTLSDVKNISADDFAENGTQLSIIGTYNRIKVENDTYPISTLLPSMDDDQLQMSDTPLSPSFFPTYIGDNKSVLQYSAHNLNIIHNLRDTGNLKKTYIRYFDLPIEKDRGIITHWYEIDNNDGTINDEDVKSTVIKYFEPFEQKEILDLTPSKCANYIGSCLCDYQTTDVNNFDDEVPELSFNRAILLCNPTPQNVTSISGFNDATYAPFKNGGQPLFTAYFKNVQTSNVSYLKIKGNIKYFCNVDCLPVQYSYDTDLVKNRCYIWGELKCGDWFLTNNSFNFDRLVWFKPTDGSRPRFKLPIVYTKGQTNAFSNSFRFTNPIYYTTEPVVDELAKLLQGKDFSIKLPTELIGQTKANIYDIEFSLFRPFVPDSSHCYARATLLTDFGMEIVNNDLSDVWNVDNDDNIKYQNVADNISVDDYDDISLKMSSWAAQPINYNALLCDLGNDNYERLTTLYNKGLGTIIRPEEAIIQTIKKQYATPTTALSISLNENNDYKPYTMLHYHFFDGKDFVINSMSKDYINNINNLQIIEKK